MDRAQEAGAWPSLTFGDAVLGGQEALLEEALQHGAHGRPVDQLQHEEVGLRGRVMLGPVPRPPWPTHLQPLRLPLYPRPLGGHVHSDTLQEQVPRDLGEKALKDQDVSLDLGVKGPRLGSLPGSSCLCSKPTRL